MQRDRRLGTNRARIHTTGGLHALTALGSSPMRLALSTFICCCVIRFRRACPSFFTTGYPWLLTDLRDIRLHSYSERQQEPRLTMRVAVIGAGPSGLVTLKYLKTAHEFFPIKPIEAKIFEAEADIGGTFAYRTYEEAELVSSKQLTTFSDFRPRKDDPDFLSAMRYLEYLRQYCDRFELWPDIEFLSPVTSILRRDGGGHIVHYRKDSKESTWECDAIAVCSGLHVSPNIPDLMGVEHIRKVLHSAEFKSREQFGQDTTVMILGTGETGVDIAHLAVTEPKVKRVVLCHRDGFLGAPKVWYHRMPIGLIVPVLNVYLRESQHQSFFPFLDGSQTQTT